MESASIEYLKERRCNLSQVIDPPSHSFNCCQSSTKLSLSFHCLFNWTEWEQQYHDQHHHHHHHHQHTHHPYHDHGNCHQVGGLLDSKGYGIAMKHGTPYKPLLDQVIISSLVSLFVGRLTLSRSVIDFMVMVSYSVFIVTLVFMEMFDSWSR